MFKLILNGTTDGTEEAIKAVKAALLGDLGFSVEQAQAFFDNLPATIKESENKAELENDLKILKEIGADISISGESKKEEESNNEVEFSFEFADGTAVEEPVVEEVKEEPKKEAPKEEGNDEIFEFSAADDATENNAEEVAEVTTEEKVPEEVVDNSMFEFSEGDKDAVETEEKAEVIKEKPKEETDSSIFEFSEGKDEPAETATEVAEEPKIGDAEEDARKSSVFEFSADESTSIREEKPKEEEKEDTVTTDEGAVFTPEMEEEQENKEEEKEKEKEKIDSDKLLMKEHTDSSHNSFSISTAEVIGENYTPVAKISLKNKILNFTKEKNIPLHYIIPIFAGSLVIIGFSTFLFPDPEEKIQIAANDSAGTAQAPKIQEDRFIKYKGSSKIEDATIKATFTANSKQISSATLEITPPPQVPLTAEEIITTTTPNPWISKIAIERLSFFDSNEKNTFISKGQARVFIEHKGRKLRTVASVIGRARLLTKEGKIKFAVLIKYNINNLPKDRPYAIKHLGDDSYNLFLKLSLEAKQE